MLWMAIAAAGLAAAGFGIGLPWGVVAVAGCLVLPLAITHAMHRLGPIRRSRPRLLRVKSVRVDRPPLRPPYVITPAAAAMVGPAKEAGDGRVGEDVP